MVHAGDCQQFFAVFRFFFAVFFLQKFQRLGSADWQINDLTFVILADWNQNYSYLYSIVTNSILPSGGLRIQLPLPLPVLYSGGENAIICGPSCARVRHLQGSKSPKS